MACYDTNHIDILKDHRTKILNSDVGQRFVVSEAKLLSGWPRCNSRVLLEEYFLKVLLHRLIKVITQFQWQQ